MIDIENKTLGDILDEVQLLKKEYKNSIYSEKQIELNSYGEIKSEYDMIWRRRK